VGVGERLQQSDCRRSLVANGKYDQLSRRAQRDVPADERRQLKHASCLAACAAARQEFGSVVAPAGPLLDDRLAMDGRLAMLLGVRLPLRFCRQQEERLP
jgi:hypothetical protein